MVAPRVLSGLLLDVDRGDYAALVLLSLVAAFDTVDHAILLTRMKALFGLNNPVFNCFRSCPSGRSSYVHRGESR
jgi:hypothetical protein